MQQYFFQVKNNENCMSYDSFLKPCFLNCCTLYLKIQLFDRFPIRKESSANIPLSPKLEILKEIDFYYFFSVLKTTNTLENRNFDFNVTPFFSYQIFSLVLPKFLSRLLSSSWHNYTWHTFPPSFQINRAAAIMSAM